MKTVHQAPAPYRPVATDAVDAASARSPHPAARIAYLPRAVGIGYGRSSGYAQRRRYAEHRAGSLFRCG